MKTINITRVSTVIGVAGMLGVAALAIAADQPVAIAATPSITDPATLKKYSHVRVINATPEQRAAAESAGSLSGMKAYVDSSGQLRAATQQEIEAEAAATSNAKVAAPAAARRSALSSAPAVFVAENGAQAELATDADMAYAVAVVDKNGKVKQACIEGQPNDKAALAVAAAGVEVDSHEE